MEVLIQEILIFMRKSSKVLYFLVDDFLETNEFWHLFKSPQTKVYPRFSFFIRSLT